MKIRDIEIHVYSTNNDFDIIVQKFIESNQILIPGKVDLKRNTVVFVKNDYKYYLLGMTKNTPKENPGYTTYLVQSLIGDLSKPIIKMDDLLDDDMLVSVRYDILMNIIENHQFRIREIKLL